MHSGRVGILAVTSPPDSSLFFKQYGTVCPSFTMTRLPPLLTSLRLSQHSQHNLAYSHALYLGSTNSVAPQLGSSRASAQQTYVIYSFPADQSSSGLGELNFGSALSAFISFFFLTKLAAFNLMTLTFLDEGTCPTRLISTGH